MYETIPDFRDRLIRQLKTTKKSTYEKTKFIANSNFYNLNN